MLSLGVSKGEVRASVQGSRAKPYTVRIGVLPIPEKGWTGAEEAIASRAVFAAKLLAGEMPRDIEDAFRDCHLSLFPSSAREVSSECSCPDWADPCKHVAAVYYLLAEAFDSDPFLIFRWRGRDRDELLARLRARRGGASEEAPLVASSAEAPPPLRDCVARFWDGGAMDDPVRGAAAPVPHAILLSLDRPAIEVAGHNLADLLASDYATIVEAARRRAAGGLDLEDRSTPTGGSRSRRTTAGRGRIGFPRTGTSGTTRRSGGRPRPRSD